jgi:uncharacterized protein (DUF983 family)
MKLICPHCGLKGKAPETLLEKKVRCPECQNVFRAKPNSPGVTVPAGQQPSSSSQEPAEAPTAGDGKCFKCGFSFDDTCSNGDQNLTICSICGRKRPLSALAA